MSEELQEIRKLLDDVDRRIIEALGDRQRLVSEVARLKSEGADRLRDMEREEDLLTRLVELGTAAGLDGNFVTRLFREILDQSVRMQQEYLVARDNPSAQKRALVVAYQGGEGSYSHIAASRHFSARQANTIFRGYPTFESMLESVRDRHSDYAILPLENTTAGSIHENYDLLARLNVSLVGEEIQRVDHCLVALEQVPISHIRRVYSHPQALAQCSTFLGTLHDCHVEAFADTALAVAKIKRDQDLSQAAIASEQAARLYGLPILKQGIANQRENYTRMVIIARDPVRVDSRIPCKTSLLFATKHERGALVSGLNVLAEHDLSMTKLESRPRPNTPWEYLFYVDFEGNIVDPVVQDALTKVAAHTSFLKILGSYPSRTTRDARGAEPRFSGGDSLAPPDSELTDAPEGVDPNVMRLLEKKPYELVSRAHRKEDSHIAIGEVVIGDAKPVVIAGPYAVESREQIAECARVAKAAGADMLRGSCFAARTSPYSFQGLGYEALDMLEEAGRSVGLPVVTEVLHPSDVERVARQADMLQVGANNMQNFALLKELGQVDRPVMLRRGLMASIDEWLQAVEYVLVQGNQQVVLCERGIRTFERATRHTLDLSAIPIVKELSHLPILVDPTHAVGERRWIGPMAEAALAAGAHGIVLEIHPNPEQAQGDGPEALDFASFDRLMKRLRARRPAP